MRLPTFTSIRITILLVALVTTGLVSAHQLVYSRNWSGPLPVVVYPINADGHIHTAEYIDDLRQRHFDIINRWAMREAKRHDIDLSTPFNVTLGPRITRLPPAYPQNANAVDVLFWGLRFRWWAWRNTPDDDQGLTRVRLFVMYHEGDDNTPLAHSLGMQKGLMGLVHAFADHGQTQQNNVVIAHELLHTVGATDKYNAYGAPQFPVGYAYPDRAPLHPQRSAEIMAGRIPVNPGRSYMAESLRSVVINDYTAAEINWVK